MLCQLRARKGDIDKLALLDRLFPVPRCSAAALFPLSVIHYAEIPVLAPNLRLDCRSCLKSDLKRVVRIKKQTVGDSPSSIDSNPRNCRRSKAPGAGLGCNVIVKN